MSGAVLNALLRDPAEVVSRCERAEGSRELALTSIACVALGAAVFGGVLGSFRGSWQIGYSAVKLPLALLATLVVCVPAFHALAVGFGGTRRFSTMAALSLAASARAALVLLACAPVLWLAVDRGLGYHASVLLASCMYLASGLAAISIILRGLGGSFKAWLTAAACGIVFFSVLGQTAWMLRPFFGRPSDDSVPFLRAREGSFADAMLDSGRSAASSRIRGSLVRTHGVWQPAEYNSVVPEVEPALRERAAPEPAAPERAVPAGTSPPRALISPTPAAPQKATPSFGANGSADQAPWDFVSDPTQDSDESRPKESP